MTKTGWRGWLDGLTRNLSGKRRRRAAGFIPAGKRPYRRLELEHLEDRLAPAFDLLVNATGATAGVTATVSGTTTTFTATATGAHLNVNDIVTALSTGNVAVDSGSTGTEAGDITINAGITSPVAGSSLTFESGSGTGVVGNITIDAPLAPAGAGQAFPLSFLALNNLAINGELDSGGSTITLTATNGAITQTSGDTLTATDLALKANTGIGTSSNPLQTQVSTLGADTSTGGIFISNGVTSAVTLNIAGNGTNVTPDGVVVTGASGDVQLINQGSIDAVTNFDVIRSPDNITVQAFGAAADVQTGGQDGTFNAIRSTGSGNVSVTAGQDILMGNASGFGSIVAAGGNTTVSAGRNLVIDFGSRLSVDGGAGDVTATAGGNITVQQTGGTSGANVRNSGSGNVSLTTGAGGTFTLDSGAGGQVLSSGGNITISADDMVINDPINAGTGIVTLKQASTTTRDIDLGGGTTAGDLGLSDAELGQVTAGVLRIGRLDNAGNLVLTAPIQPTGTNTLDLRSGGAVAESAGTDPRITVTNLALQAAKGIADGNTTEPISNTVLDVAVMNLAALNTASGQIMIAENLGDLTVGVVDGVVGFQNLATTDGGVNPDNLLRADAGNVTINALTSTAADPLILQANGPNGTITNNATISSSNGATVALESDLMSLSGGAITAGTGRVALLVHSAGRLIDVGGNSDGARLILKQGDLDTITAGVLQIGTRSGFLFGGDNGEIIITRPTTLTNVPTLDLEAAGIVGQFAPLTVANLAVRSDDVVSLTFSNSIDNLAGVSQSFSVNGAGNLVVGTVDGLTGVTTNDGAVSVNTTSGNLTVNQNISAGAAAVSLTAGGANHLFSNNAAISNGGGNPIDIDADQMALGASPTSTITAAGGGRVRLAPVSGGQPIHLGAAGDPSGSLSLSDAELNTITTTGVLQIGLSVPNPITVAAAIHPSHVGTLTIRTQDAINDNGGVGSITVGNLLLFAFNGVSLTGANSVGNLAGIVATAGPSFVFNNVGALDVNTVDGDSGVISGGPIQVATSNGNLTVDQGVLAGAAPLSLTAGGADSFITNNNFIIGTGATLTADRMALDAGTIRVGTGAANVVTLQPFTPGRTIDLGGTGDPTGTLQISQAELDTITAGILRLGAAAAGNLTVTAAVGATHFTTLSLLTGAGVVESAGTLTVTNLAISASSGIGSAGALLTAVGNLAFSNLAAGAVQISNTGAATITAIDGILTSANQGGDTTLTTLGGLVFAVNTTSAGALRATADESGAGSDDIVVNPGVEVFSAVARPGDLVLRAGDNLIVHTGGNLQTPNGGNIILDIGFNDTDGDGSGGSVIQGLLIGDSITVNGGPGTNVLLLDFANGADLPMRGLTYNGGASGRDVLKISDAGSAVGHTYALSPGALARSLAAPIAFNHLSLVNIDAGDGSDTFNVTPSATTAFNVNGANPTPPANPGDELSLNLAGTTNPTLNDTFDPASGHSGAWNFGNAKAVTFTGIETLNSNSGAVVVTGGNNLVVNATNSNSGSYTLDGGPAVSFSNATSFTFNGGLNMTVNNPSGGLFAPTGGVFDNGGAAFSDSLIVQNGAAVSETFDYAPNSADGGRNGDFTLTGAGGATTHYTYTQLSLAFAINVNVQAPQSIVFNLPNNGLDNQVILGPDVGQVPIRDVNGEFETTFASYAMGATITVNATGSVAQTFNVQSLPGAVVVLNDVGAGAVTLGAVGAPVGTPPGGLNLNGALQVLYSGVAHISLDNASGVDAFYGPDTADRATAFTGLSAQERFVQALYLDALGRAGTKAELDGWVALFNGLTQSQAQLTIATGIEHSAEGRDHLVQSWYQTFLGRAAVGGEEQGFVNALLGGQTEEQVLSLILGSQEFYNRTQTLSGATGTADQNFVAGLYQLVLNRAGAPGEGAAFVAALASQGRQGVALDFLTSAEFRTHDFEGYYNALLHRPSDPNNLDATGLNSWVMSNLDIGTVRLGFEASPEFFFNG